MFYVSQEAMDCSTFWTAFIIGRLVGGGQARACCVAGIRRGETGHNAGGGKDSGAACRLDLADCLSRIEGERTGSTSGRVSRTGD
jgi:hypothetical protein